MCGRDCGARSAMATGLAHLGLQDSTLGGNWTETKTAVQQGWEKQRPDALCLERRRKRELRLLTAGKPQSKSVINQSEIA